MNSRTPTVDGAVFGERHGGGMVGGWLKLKFEDKGAGLVAGAAWVVSNGREITPDCATFGELDARLRELEEDIKAIRRRGRKEFARCQGAAGN